MNRKSFSFQKPMRSVRKNRAYHALYSCFYNHPDYQLRESCLIETYLNSLIDTPESELKTEIKILIQKKA